MSSSVWLRVRLPQEVHQILKVQAKEEGRLFTDLAASVLTDAIQGNLAIGQPPSGDAGRDSYAVKKPSDQPLSAYAKDAADLTIVGTTLRSLKPFMGFLRGKASRGTYLTFVMISDEVLSQDSFMLGQVALRHGTSRDEVLAEARRTTAELEQLRRDFPVEVKIVKLPFLPSFGMTLVDPDTEREKMRVGFYLFHEVAECNPQLHITPSSEDARYIWRLFMRHFRQLLREAEKLEEEKKKQKREAAA